MLAVKVYLLRIIGGCSVLDHSLLSFATCKHSSTYSNSVIKLDALILHRHFCRCVRSANYNNNGHGIPRDIFRLYVHDLTRHQS